MTHITVINGNLQINHETGEILFHAKKSNKDVNPTPLCIYGLKSIRRPLGKRKIQIFVHQFNVIMEITK